MGGGGGGALGVRPDHTLTGVFKFGEAWVQIGLKVVHENRGGGSV